MSRTRPTAARVLVVTDWRLDPHAVVARLARDDGERHATWTLLVPAWLHGRDWAGDPAACRPCAELALMTLRELAENAGLDVDVAIIGDPDPVTAVADATASLR